MTNEEFDKLCEEMLAQGMTEKDILGVILKMFEDDKIDLEEMKKLAGARGYELSEEFLSKVGEGEGAPAPESEEEEAGVSEEEIEDAQETDESESESDESDEDEEDEDEDEEDEKKKARKLFDLE